MRSYSIASAPSDSKVIELAIERLLDGEVSPFFHDVAQVGDTIERRGPLGGHFLWPGRSNKPVLLTGAGSGVVPLIAMIRYRKASVVAVPVALLLSSRTWCDVPFRDELLKLEKSLPDFALALALTRESARAAPTSVGGSTPGWSLTSRGGCPCPPAAPSCAGQTPSSTRRTPRSHWDWKPERSRTERYGA
jgi:ferredoxin-NADP reductase